MKIVNVSGKPEGVLRSWLPRDLEVETVVFLPDACPGKSPLPTGTAVFTRQPDWRRFAVSDCGCGMRLLKSGLKHADITQALWDRLAEGIRANKGGLGDLGGGNHFLDAVLPYDEENIYFLVHTGSRDESGCVDNLIDKPSAFDAEFGRVIGWAEANRAAIQQTLEAVTGPLEVILDKPHNTYETVDDGVLIRKGAVRTHPGDLNVIPSHMSGDLVLVEATESVGDLLHSLSHGTGRTMSRGDAKQFAATFDFRAMRETLIMPSFLQDASLTTEAPYAYRDLDECMQLLAGYVKEVHRFSVIAYAGHL